MDKDDYYMTAHYLNEQRLVRRKFDLMLQAYSIVGVLGSGPIKGIPKAGLA